MDAHFDWDEAKNRENLAKHGVSFEEAQRVFADPHLLVLRDVKHSTQTEERLYAVGRIPGGIVTVRFTFRTNVIRIFGAGFWRNYRRRYLERLGDKEE